MTKDLKIANSDLDFHETQIDVRIHRNIKNTLLYTQLVKTQSEDEYVCRVAKTVEQAAELIEAGFEYVCEINGAKLFRKRK